MLDLANALDSFVEFIWRSVYAVDSLEKSDALHADVGRTVICQHTNFRGREVKTNKDTDIVILLLQSGIAGMYFTIEVRYFLFNHLAQILPVFPIQFDFRMCQGESEAVINRS